MPFAPTDISGLQLWHDAQDIATLWTNTGGTTAVTADGDSVARWDDKSGNGRNSTQGTSGSRPKYKTNIVNGHPVVRFDGTDDWIETPSFTVNQPVHAFIVMAQLEWVSADRIMDGTTTDRCVFNQFGSRPNMTLYAGSAFDCVLTTLATNEWAILTLLFNGASSGIRKNGGAMTTGNPGSTGITDGRTFGAKHNGTVAAQVDIAEILIYNSSLGATDRGNVESYLTTKWLTAGSAKLVSSPLLSSPLLGSRLLGT